jgi:peptidoglycan/xylan/chitin deacetylase (PgdA/CDA1 family)
MPSMNWWRKLALTGYYYGTLPYRVYRRRQAEASGMAPVSVLFYHRIADDAASPWTLPNRAFARQMRWLKSRFDLLSLAEAQRRIARRENHRQAVCITFDDGYAANCHEAIPLLIAEKIPCTYFVSSRCVLEGIPFPHDVARGCEGRPNTIDEIRAMAAEGIDIGAHTRSHVDLGRVNSPRKLHEEVVVAGEELQQAIGAAVRYFAFPYGQTVHLNQAAFRLAHEYGYEGVCSAYGGYNFPGDDPFHIQRVCADDLLRLKNWVTVDPRKVRSHPRFDYLTQADAEPAGATIS